MATPSSSMQSYSLSSFEEKNKQLHTMATQTTGGAEQGTQTRNVNLTCECIHTEMGHNNYHYPYHACGHQRRRNMFGWHCCPNYACKHHNMTTYYTTPMTQGDNYIIQPIVPTTTTQPPVPQATTTSVTASKTTQAGIKTARKSATKQFPIITTSSSSTSNSPLTYTMPARVSQQKQQENSLSSLSSMLLIGGHLSSSEVSIPMGSKGNASSSTTTTTHQYDDLNSMERRKPSKHNIAVQTSSTLLLAQIPEEVAPGLQSAPLRMKPKSIAYVLEFSTNYSPWQKTHKSNIVDDAKQENEQEKANNVDADANESRQRMTLQAHLEQARPAFVAHTKERKALLNKLQVLRQQREKELREIIENTSFNSIDRKLSNIPPPAIGKKKKKHSFA